MARGSVNQVVEALAKVDLFEGLSQRQLKVLASECREQIHADGATIVADGDTSARFYLITDGTADVKVNGRKRTELGAGQYFGEIAVLDKGPRTAAVIASSTCTTLSLAPFNMRAALRENPDMALRLLVAVCARLRAADKALTS